jgi:hypothetical protein
MWRGTRSFFCIDPKEPYLELHRSAWKGNSQKFALTEFSEVRQEACSDAARSDDAHRREGLYAC